MLKKITTRQLKKAVDRFPKEVKSEADAFLQRGLSEYKRITMQTSPWRTWQKGGGAPKATNNLREQHRTKIEGLEGRFGVEDSAVPYAKYVHGNKPYQVKVRGKNLKTRPWLNYAMNRADNKVKKHYNVLIDNLFQLIAQ